MMRLLRHRWTRRLALAGVLAAVGAVLGVVTVWACDRAVVGAAEGRIFARVEDAPEVPVALVLGTSPTVEDESGTRSNLFFTLRMDAAAELYRAGKVKHLLVSGDNGRKDYDEPTAMRDALIARGVPAGAITLDYAGFRTLDSVVRARDVFGQSKILIVSQAFHCERAVYLARAHGIDAVGVAARGVGGRAGRLMQAREALARTAAVLDTNVLGTKPRFPGPPEPIVLAPPPKQPTP